MSILGSPEGQMLSAAIKSGAFPLRGTTEDRINQLIRESNEWWVSRLNSQPHHPIERVVGEPPGKTMNTPEVSHEVYRPKHYTDGGIEAIDYIRAKLGDEGFIAYCIGNALKYLSRAGKKRDNKTQDLEKASVYLGWAIETSLGKEITK